VSTRWLRTGYAQGFPPERGIAESIEAKTCSGVVYTATKLTLVMAIAIDAAAGFLKRCISPYRPEGRLSICPVCGIMAFVIASRIMAAGTVTTLDVIE